MAHAGAEPSGAKPCVADKAGAQGADTPTMWGGAIAMLCTLRQISACKARRTMTYGNLSDRSCFVQEVNPANWLQLVEATPGDRFARMSLVSYCARMACGRTSHSSVGGSPRRTSRGWTRSSRTTTCLP